MNFGKGNIKYIISGIKIPGLKPWRSVKDNRFMYLTFYYAHSGKQITSELSHTITSFYMRRESTSNIYTMSVPRTGNQRLVGPAQALCWGRATGVMCNIWHFPVSGPPRARAWTVPGCQDSFLLSSTTGVSWMQKD